MESGSDIELAEGTGQFNSEDDASNDASSDEEDLHRIRDNDPRFTTLDVMGGYGDVFHNMNNEKWEELGRDISNNTHLEDLQLYNGTLNDETLSYLFRGLVRSSSIKALVLNKNGFSAAAVRSMVPFLQNANLEWVLDLGGNNIQSEGFSLLLRALRDSPIGALEVINCGIESIEIDTDHFPRKLAVLDLSGNNIDADGCREIAKLLQRGDCTLANLMLNESNIDDEGVAILVGALHSNTSLSHLESWGNDISDQGYSLFLKVMNDISSVKATLQSNHTLQGIIVRQYPSPVNEIERQINVVTDINRNHDGNPEAAGREKVIQTQLNSVTRAALTELQGVNHSVYSEINPLHLPEVLSLVGRRHGEGELFVALKSSIAEVITTVNRRQCITQQLEYHEAKSAELRAELAQLDAAGGDTMDVGNEACSNKSKRPRSSR